MAKKIMQTYSLRWACNLTHKEYLELLYKFSARTLSAANVRTVSTESVS